MENKNSVIEQINFKTLLISASVSAVMGLTLMALFIFTIDSPDPAWGELWEIKPLVVITFATALGGAMFYLIHLYFAFNRWNKVLALVVSLIVYIIGFWMGSILGLNGTLWD